MTAPTGRAERARFAIGLFSLMGVTALLGLTIWATVVPLALGWESVAVLSGSMEPGIAAGDVVVTSPHDGAGLGPGTVIVFSSPTGKGKVTHRIVDVTPSGDYVTRGDRNDRVDSDPVTADQVIGVGRILVPVVGKPYEWAYTGAWINLALAAVVAAAAFWTSRWVLLDRFNPWRDPEETPQPAGVGLRVSRADMSALVVVLLVGSVVTGTGSNAAFAASTGNAGNSWTADVLQAPTGVAATDGATITIDWTATVDTYATGHRVLRSTSPGGPYTQIAQVTPRTTVTYVDSPAFGTYYYVVRAYYQNWESVNSSEVSATAGITLDDSTLRRGEADTSLSWNHKVADDATDSILIVGVSSNNVSVTGVTYDGQALTFLGAQTDPNSTSRMEMWYIVDPNTGNNTVAVEMSATAEVVAGSTSWTGVHQTTPLGSFTSASGNSATASVNVSSAAGEFVVDTVANVDGGSLTVGSGQDEHWNDTWVTIAGGGSSEPGAATTTMSWTLPSNYWAIGAVALKPAR